MIPCWVCGQLFDPFNSKSKYCGLSCQTKAKKAARRERRLQKHLEKCIDV